MQILFGVFDGIAHRFPSKGKKKMRLMARNRFVSNYCCPVKFLWGYLC